MTWYLLRQAIASYNYFLIFTHRDPDGDAIGSCGAICCLLRRLGKEAYVVLERPLEDAYDLILPRESVLIVSASGTGSIDEGPLHLELPWVGSESDCGYKREMACLWLDFQDSVRLGRLASFFDKRASSLKPSRGSCHGLSQSGDSECGDSRYRDAHSIGAGDLALLPLAVIDHHTPRAGQTLPDLHVVDASASSCGVLVYQLFHLMGLEIDPQSAGSLYWAVVSDTAHFSVTSTRSLDLEIAAECVRLGVNPALYQEALNERFRQEIVVEGLTALQSVQRECDNRVWIFQLPHQTYSRSGTSLLRFIHSLMPKILEPQAWLVVVEEAPGLWRFSARSRYDLQLGMFFQQFGGGGHCSAAGVVLTSKAPQIVESFKLDMAKKLALDRVTLTLS